MKSFALMLGLGLAAHLPCAIVNGEVTEIHVSPRGNDQSSGAQDQPIQTLHRAAELVRQSRSHNPKVAVEVIVQAGEYALEKQLTLTELDSGSASAPVIYKAAQGQEVIITGAVKPTRLAMAAEIAEYQSLLQPAAASKVVVYEASTEPAAWIIAGRGELLSLEPSPLQLFANGRCFPQSSYPDTGWLKAGEAQGLAETLRQNESSNNAWIHGFPANDYQDEFQALHSVKPEDWRSESRFRVTNSLRELDQPGEWFLDSNNQKILWWPEKDDDSALRVANLETLISLYDVEYLRLEGFTFEGSRVQAVEIAGGFGCEIRNCLVRCIGNVGINIFHGQEHCIEGCDVHSTGSSGIRMEGGNRESGIPANHVCRGNDIHHCGTQHLARHAALAAYGVGMTIQNNTISEVPDWAISISGDEIMVRSNHIHHACSETTDTGAIYLTDDTGYQRNVVCQNHIHDLGGHSSRDVFGIYLDNGSGRNEVAANLIHDAPRAIVARGGSDNTLAANIIYDCWIGVQFQWTEDSQGNFLYSNTIEADHRLLVSQPLPGALHQDLNLDSVKDLFVDVRAGDLRFANQALATELKLSEGLFENIPFDENPTDQVQESRLISKE